MNWLSSLVGGFVRGIGTSLMDWWRTRKAERDRARADSMEAANQGEREATLTEMAVEKARKEASEKAGRDPTYWG